MKHCFVGLYKSIDMNRPGGVETVIRELTKALARGNNEIVVYIIDLGQNTVDRQTTNGVLIEKGNIDYIRTQLLKKTYDVVHFLHTPFNDPFFTLQFYFKKRKKAFLTTKFFLTYPIYRKYPFFEKIKYRYLIDKGIVFSKRLEIEAKKLTSDLIFLYPPVADIFFEMRTRRKAIDKTRIAFLGRLSNDKGLDMVIRIFRLLNPDHYQMHIGGYFTNLDDEKKYMPRLSALKNVQLSIVPFAGDVTKSDYPDLSEIDILLLPYQSLAPTVDFPLLLMEGQVAGCQVIASNIGALSSLPGQLHLVDNYTSKQAFIDSIESIKTTNVGSFDFTEWAPRSIALQLSNAITTMGTK